MMLHLRISGLIILISLIGFFPPRVAHGQVLEQTFSDNQAGFKISTPGHEWYFVPRSLAPGVLRAVLRFESPVNRFIPNTTVRVTPLADPNFTLKDLVKQGLKALSPEVKIIKKNGFQHEGLDGYEVVWLDKKSNLIFWQWIFLVKGKSYILTCTAKSPSFVYFKEDFKKILNSFEIR